MTDMRKWINLAEAKMAVSGLKPLPNFGKVAKKLGKGWHHDRSMPNFLVSEMEVDDDDGEGPYLMDDVHEQWFELLDGSGDELYEAADFFQKFLKPEYRPAWISNMKIIDDEDYYWKIERGEPDPDDY